MRGTLKSATMVAFLVLIPACTEGVSTSTNHPAPQGAALQPAVESWARIPPIAPGTRWILMLAFLKNISSEAVTLEEVSFEGTGLGSVVAIDSIEFAPLPPLVSRYQFAAGGIFTTDPPANRFPGDQRCSTQTLLPLEGARLGPGEEARLAVYMTAAEPGVFDLHSHVVSYETNSVRYQQSIPVGMRGRVARTGDGVPLEPAQEVCVTGENSLSH